MPSRMHLIYLHITLLCMACVASAEFCDTATCLSGGSCLPQYNGFCACTPGYAGIHCQYPRSCSAQSPACSGPLNGMCNAGTSRCECSSGRWGDACEFSGPQPDAGYYFNVANSQVMACPTATYQGDFARTFCFFVPAGYYPGNTAGNYVTSAAVAKYPCPSGSYCNATNAFQPRTCPSGYAPDSTRSKCVICLPGTVSADGKQCLACSAGKYAADAGQALCSTVSAGYFAAIANSSTVISSPLRIYWPYVPVLEGATHSIACQPGWNCSGAEAAPELCPAGTYSSQYPSSVCQACPSGHVAPAGSTNCTSCAATSQVAAASQDVCYSCPIYKYAANGTSCIACPPSQISGSSASCFPAFDFCPKAHVFSTTELEAAGSNYLLPTVQLPRLAEVLDKYGPNLTVSPSTSGAFAQGRTNVTYSLTLTGVPGAPVMTCSFPVDIVRGSHVTVVQLGAIINSTLHREVAAAESTLHGNSAQLPGFSYDDLTQGNISLTLRAPDNLNFLINPQQGSSPTVNIGFAITAAWCASQEQIELDYRRYSTSGSSVEVWVRTADTTGQKVLEAVRLNTTTANFKVRSSNRCFMIELVSQTTSEYLSFRAITVSARLPSNFSPRTAQTYLPVSGSIAYFFLNNSAAVLAQWQHLRAASTADVQAPTFANCPEPMAVAVDSGLDRVVVNWTEPTASDNVPGVVVTRNLVSGQPHWLWESPLDVVYTATDTSGNINTCAFTVTLAKNDWQTRTVAAKTADQVRTSSVEYALQQPVATATLTAAINSSSLWLPASGMLDLTGATALEWQLYPPVSMVFQIEAAGSNDASRSLEIDIAWSVQSTVNFQAIRPFIRVQLHNATDLHGTPLNLSPHWFSTSPTTVISSSLVQIRGSAYLSRALRHGARFFGVTVTVFFATGFEVSGGAGGDDPELLLSNIVLLRSVFGVQAYNEELSSSALAVVFVDQTPPEMTCPEDVVIVLDRNTTVTYADVPVTWLMPSYLEPNATLLSDPPTRYAVGNHNVKLRAIDASYNEASCTFMVSIQRLGGSQEGSKGDSLSGAIVVGVVVVLVSAIIITIVVVVRRRRRKPYDFSERIRELSEHMRGADGLIKPREVKREAVRLLQVLGAGNWGEVHKGMLGEHRAAGMPEFLVAVKTLKIATSDSRDELMREACFMAQLNCDYIVKLHGVVTLGEPFMMVMEYCEHGSVHAFLQKQDIEQQQKLTLAHDAAQGLKYLASRHIVHRDVASRNVLLSSEFRGRLADFGMSRESEAESAYYTSRGGAVPVRWSAPEALDQHKFSEKSDVWAFGVLCYELWTRAELPYKGMSNQRVWMEVTSGRRLEKPADCPQAVYATMLQCWREAAADRPTFSDLVAQYALWLESGVQADGAGPHADGSKLLAAAPPTSQVNTPHNVYYMGSSLADPTAGEVQADAAGKLMQSGGNAYTDLMGQGGRVIEASMSNEEVLAMATAGGPAVAYDLGSSTTAPDAPDRPSLAGYMEVGSVVEPHTLRKRYEKALQGNRSATLRSPAYLNPHSDSTGKRPPTYLESSGTAPPYDVGHEA